MTNEIVQIYKKDLKMDEDREKLTFDDIDILESVGSDLCESIRDLIYNIKEIKNDVDNIKEYLHL